MADADGATPVGLLAGSLWESERESAEPNGNADKRRVELHHRHLPMLVDAGALSYDAESGTVRRGEHFEEIYSLLRTLDSHRDDLPSD